MTNWYKKSRQIAIKNELSAYRGNQDLKKYYLHLIDDGKKYHQKVITWCKKDLIRVQGNLDFVERKISSLEKQEQEFIRDVYIRGELSMEQIKQKYNLKKGKYYLYLEKIISFLAVLDP